MREYGERNKDQSESEGKTVVYSGKTDVQSAFRLVPLNKRCWRWLIMKAQDPTTGEWKFFVDKCLPFGASISCAIFQWFSNALKFLIEFRMSVNSDMDTTDTVTNYLDDFLFLALTIMCCNFLIREFLHLCDQVGVPIAIDKTEWASDCVIFLGILLDGRHYIMRIPLEKRMKAIKLICNILDQKKSKATVKELQELCGYLNFLCKAIFPGHPFIRYMYAKYSNCVHVAGNSKDSDTSKFHLETYHHVRIDREFKADCRNWLEFLENGLINDIVNRPMIGILAPHLTSRQISFYLDASASKKLGYGCVLDTKWLWGRWNADFITEQEPSIEYLELFALTAGIITWAQSMTNCRITVHCDNTAVVTMINNLMSKCKNCMVLICLLTLNGLHYNRCLRAVYVSTKDNFLADALSRGQLTRFRCLGPGMDENPWEIHQMLWPLEEKLWIRNS